jgi:hypothetical protein
MPILFNFNFINKCWLYAYYILKSTNALVRYVHNMNSYWLITHSEADARIHIRLKMTQKKGRNMQRLQLMQIKTNVDTVVSILFVLYFKTLLCRLTPDIPLSYEDRTWAREAEESPLLEVVAMEQLMKTQQAGKRLSRCCGNL